MGFWNVLALCNHGANLVKKLQIKNDTHGEWLQLFQFIKNDNYLLTLMLVEMMASTLKGNMYMIDGNSHH